MKFLLIITVILLLIYYIRKISNNKDLSQQYDKGFSNEKNYFKNNRNKKDQYRQIIKSSSDKDNMNCTMYIFSGKYSETNRMRKNKTAYVFDGEDPLDVIIGMGYTDPIEYVKSDFPSPSEAQMNYLMDLTYGHVPDNVSFYDASALIDHYVNKDDKTPNSHLFHFAEQMHIPVSYYCGKKRLYNQIFDGLQERDKIAFFIFQVYRDYYNDHEIANMNNSSHKNLFYEFADSMINNESFMKSLNKYSGESLRIFGTHTYNGYTVYGGSKNTIAYKETLAFLKENI